MNIDFYKKHWRVFLLLAALILLFIFVGSSIEGCGNWWNNRKAGEYQTNINASAGEAVNQQQRVNKQAENYNNARKETNEARDQTNQSLNAYNTVRDANYNGASFSNANAARCRYNPNGQGCR